MYHCILACAPVAMADPFAPQIKILAYIGMRLVSDSSAANMHGLRFL